jgi:glycerophosphoryl diester phosphodiesterase
MDVIAHRGFAAEGVENALPTLRAAERPADAVEFDVRLAGDGTPVVFHDDRVDRLTAATGPVAAFDAAELGQLSLAGTDATVPTLERMLSALSGPIVADLKVDRVPDGLVSRLRNHDARVLVSSADPRVLATLPRDLATAVLVLPASVDGDWSVPDGAPRSFEDGIALAERVNAVAIHAHTSLCNASRVRRAQTAVFAVNAYTVRDGETAASMRAAGVDGLIVDSPAVV